MHKRLLKYLLALTLLAGAAAPLCAASRGWETIRYERGDTKTVARAQEFELKAASGVITVTSSQPVQVKIFTILGRLVSSETVPQGISQFILPAHGVYIVKIGDVTCKVAV